MRWLVLIVTLLTSSCGVGYVAPTAVIRLEFHSVPEMEAASAAIQRKLNGWGFHVAPASTGWPADMLNALPADERWRTAHTIEFWRHTREDLRGDITAYPSAEFGSAIQRSGVSTEPHFPFLELTLSDLRPGGFSSEGLGAYAELTAFLRQQHYTVVVVSEPPPADEKEHLRIVLTNALTMSAWWLVSWAAGIAIIGGLADWGMRAAGGRQWVRRIVLVCVGVLLATPLPVPTMFVTVWAPNLLCAFGGPRGYAALAKEFGALLPAAFAVSLCLSVLAAAFLIRAGDRDAVIGPQKAE
jgi:hypothetical protein